MSVGPIFYHLFKRPLPYAPTLALQELIHSHQLVQRRTNSHHDYLLLLEHRPVYTAGRRQTEDSVNDERDRLVNIGAEFITTARGGQLTYHGPGQIVGYPLLDLSRSSPPMGIRDYICLMQKTLSSHISEAHGIQSIPSDNTGVFLTSTTKIASIGVQVRHRLTTHGFAINVTKEPIPWFNQVVACGLQDVKAGSIEGASEEVVDVDGEMIKLTGQFGRVYAREMVALDISSEGVVAEAIRNLEAQAERAGDWKKVPKTILKP